MEKCLRCKGLGYIRHYTLINDGICYQCNGSGKELTKVEKAKAKETASLKKETRTKKHNEEVKKQNKEMYEKAISLYNDKVKELEELRNLPEWTEETEEKEDDLINDLVSYSEMVKHWETKINK